MTPSGISFLAGLVNRHSGVLISADKAYLLTSRLRPVARRHGFASPEGLVEALERGSRDIRLIDEVVEALTVSTEVFFRDPLSFQTITEDVLPDLFAARSARRRLRCWCVGVGGGQEAYSLALVLRDAVEALEGWHLEIVATDASAELLEKARSGLYSQFEVRQGLPVRHLAHHFERRGEIWQVEATLRSMLRFTRLDMSQPLSGLGTFDLILCRDVLDHLEAGRRADLVQRIADQLDPGGYLVLGAGEAAPGVAGLHPAVEGGIYRKAGAPDHARRPAA